MAGRYLSLSVALSLPILAYKKLETFVNRWGERTATHLEPNCAVNSTTSSSTILVSCQLHSKSSLSPALTRTPPESNTQVLAFFVTPKETPILPVLSALEELKVFLLHSHEDSLAKQTLLGKAGPHLR